MLLLYDVGAGIFNSDPPASDVVGRGGNFSSASSGIASSNEPLCPAGFGLLSSSDRRSGLNLRAFGGPNGLGGRGMLETEC